MHYKSYVKLSNAVALIATILLLYWVFIFTAISVFGLKIFKENITEIFYLSVLGILALLFGALVINIMSNLTSVSLRRN